MKTGPRKRNRRKTTDIQLALKFHWRPQQARKERLESHTNRLHNGSTRLLTYRSVSDQTGNTWSEKQEHEGSYLELDSPKSPLRSYMILKFFFIAVISRIKWTLQSLPTEITNKGMEKYNSYLQATGAPAWDHIAHDKEERPIVPIPWLTVTHLKFLFLD